MGLSIGDKVHVVERRLFESDLRRHFIGEVIDTDLSTVVVRGWVFIFDGSSASFQRHPEKRTRVVSLVDARILVNLLPDEAQVENARYETDDNAGLTVTDGANFSLAMNEFGFRR